MATLPPLPSWQQRDNLSKRAHQAIVDRVNTISNISGKGMNISRDPNGLGISAQDQPEYFGKGVKVLVEDIAAPGGMYWGRIPRGTTTPDPTSTKGQFQPEGQLVLGWKDALIINIGEDQSGGALPSDPLISQGTGTAFDPSDYQDHTLDFPRYYMGFITGVVGYQGGQYFVVEINIPSLPVGEFQYMIYQDVTQNQSGFDFLMASPTL